MPTLLPNAAARWAIEKWANLQIIRLLVKLDRVVIFSQIRFYGEIFTLVKQ